MKRVLAPPALFFVGVLTALMAVGRTAMIRDPGFLWHTVAGERMLASGHVVRADPFSASRAGAPWIAMEWLAECVMALLHRVAGMDTLLLAGATVIAAVFAILGRRLMGVGCRPLSVCLLLVLGAAASANHLIVRPHLASIALFTWTVATLIDVEAGRRGVSRLAWLVPVSALWANLHGGVLAGLATTGVTVAGWVLLRALGRESPATSRARIGLLVFALALAAAATLANPYGTELLATWLRIIRSRDVSRVLAEHQPLYASPEAALGVTLLGALYAALLRGVPRKELRVTWLLPLVLFPVAWTQVIYAPYFALATLLVLPELLPRCEWLARVTAGTGSLWELGPVPDKPGAKVLVLPVIVVAAVAALQLAGIRAPVFGAGWARLDPSTAPLEMKGALDAVAARSADGTGVLNDLDFGGFCIYFEPRLRVVVDDRYELYGAFLSEYLDAYQRHPEAAEQLADRWELRVALVRAGSPFARGLDASPRWKRVAQGDVAAVYERR